VQHDVPLVDRARARQRFRERFDSIIPNGEDDDGRVTDPRRRLAAVAHREGERWRNNFLFSAVEADGIVRSCKRQRQSNSRATGPDEPDRAGRLRFHRLRTVDGVDCAAIVRRS
jgi:hypothetical protein